LERDDTALEKVYKEEEEEEAEEEEDEEEEEEEEEEGFTKKKKTKKHASTNRWQLSRTQHIKDSQDQILVPALGRKSLKTFQVPSSLGSGVRDKNLSSSDAAMVPTLPGAVFEVPQTRNPSTGVPQTRNPSTKSHATHLNPAHKSLILTGTPWSLIPHPAGTNPWPQIPHPCRDSANAPVSGGTPPR